MTDSTLDWAKLRLGRKKRRRLQVVAGGGGTGRPASPLLNNLVAHWSMEELSGSRADNYVNNISLAESGGVSSTAGKVGNAALFSSASSQYLSHPDTPALKFGDIDWTIAFWVRMDVISGLRALVTKYAGGSNRSMRIIVRPSGIVQLYVYNSAGTEVKRVSYSATSLTIGTYYWVQAWHRADTDQVGINVNNGLPNIDSYVGTPGESTAPFYVGQLGTGTDYLDGAIDELGYWHRLLTDAETTWLYNGGTGRSWSEIVNYGG